MPPFGAAYAILLFWLLHFVVLALVPRRCLNSTICLRILLTIIFAPGDIDVERCVVLRFHNYFPRCSFHYCGNSISAGSFTHCFVALIHRLPVCYLSGTFVTF